MIQNPAHSRSNKVSLFTDPQITLGYATFDFEVEEAFHPGAIALASASSGYCEIADGRETGSPEGDPLMRETLAMFGHVSSADLPDLLTEAPDWERCLPLFKKTRESIEAHTKRVELERYKAIKAAQAGLADITWETLLAS